MTFQKPLKLYKLAAEKNGAYATFQLGELYYKGHGVPQDYLTGAEYYLKAFKLGHKNGMSGIRSCLLHGDGLPKNNELADRILHSVMYSNNDFTPSQRRKITFTYKNDVFLMKLIS
jgi:TPR repeat protein